MKTVKKLEQKVRYRFLKVVFVGATLLFLVVIYLLTFDEDKILNSADIKYEVAMILPQINHDKLTKEIKENFKDTNYIKKTELKILLDGYSREEKKEKINQLLEMGATIEGLNAPMEESFGYKLKYTTYRLLLPISIAIVFIFGARGLFFYIVLGRFFPPK